MIHERELSRACRAFGVTSKSIPCVAFSIQRHRVIQPQFRSIMQSRRGATDAHFRRPRLVRPLPSNTAYSSLPHFRRNSTTLRTTVRHEADLDLPPTPTCVDLTDSKLKIIFTLKYRELSYDSRSVGWLKLFNDPVIAHGFPIPPRSSGTGLEMRLGLVATEDASKRLSYRDGIERCGSRAMLAEVSWEIVEVTRAFLG